MREDAYDNQDRCDEMCIRDSTGCDSEETKAAKESFNNEVERVQASYDALTAEIATAEELVVTEERPLDETLKPALEDTISDAKTVEFKSPSMPSGIDNINACLLYTSRCV